MARSMALRFAWRSMEMTSTCPVPSRCDELDRPVVRPVHLHPRSTPSNFGKRGQDTQHPVDRVCPGGRALSPVAPVPKVGPGDGCGGAGTSGRACTSCLRCRSPEVGYVHDTTHHGDRRLALTAEAPAGEQAVLVAAEPERFFVPPYLGHRGLVGLWLDARPPTGRRSASCWSSPTASARARRPRQGARGWRAPRGASPTPSHRSGSAPTEVGAVRSPPWRRPAC